jgi:hypothetical protein
MPTASFIVISNQVCKTISQFFREKLTSVGNILLKYTEKGWLLKFADFGLSKFVGSSQAAKTTVGTPIYEGI